MRRARVGARHARSFAFRLPNLHGAPATEMGIAHVVNDAHGAFAEDVSNPITPADEHAWWKAVRRARFDSSHVPSSLVLVESERNARATIADLVAVVGRRDHAPSTIFPHERSPAMPRQSIAYALLLLTALLAACDE